MVIGLLGRLQVRHLYPAVPVAAYAAASAASVQDNSFLWHVRAGALQMALGRVLTIDPFSYTAGGESWRTQSWLADLLYGYLESTLGSVGWAPVLVGAVGVMALSITGLSVYSSSRATFATGVWLAVVVWLLIPFAQPRPVAFSYLLLAILVLALATRESAQWAVVPILWIWAGLHGSWIIGLGLVALQAIRQRSPRLGALTGVALGMTALTAHGIGTWSVLVSFARNSAALDYIQEWHPPDFSDIVQAPYVLIVVGILVAAVLGKLKASMLWIIIPFLLLGFTTRRAVPVAALVLIPFAARWTVYRLPQTRPSWTPVPAIAMLALIGAVTAMYLAVGPIVDRTRFPSDDAIEELGDRRFFHDMAAGGYLIYRDGPQRQVYIDDRAELYGVQRFAEHADVLMGAYEALFNRLGMSAALVERDWPLRDVLLRDGWDVEYRDDRFEVLGAPDH